MRHGFVSIAIALFAISSLRAADAPARPDVLIADFEGKDYGTWKAEGEAFGPAPANGTLRGQMKVEGFLGRGLANSFNKGDGSTGALTSPPFKLERQYLRFLIGGGGYAGETCMNLLVEGRVARTAVGPNVVPGGSESLEWQQWDVADLAGNEAIIQIVDRRTGGWGHINVDHIIQTDAKLVPIKTNTLREISLNRNYLNIPIKNGATKRVVTLSVDGQTVRRSEIELADTEPDWWAVMDVAAFKGKTGVLCVNKLPANSTGLSAIEPGDSIKGGENLYAEALRPQFHFTQKRGWNNDPNGMVYYDGEWHLFFQHNPYGWGWANMHWGHAVSKDLVHWQELPTALYPWTQAKAHCFSGTAAIDWNNTTGFQKGNEKTMVAAFTDTGCGEALAYSTDRGRTFTYFDGNPVVKHKGRDPKIFWYAPNKHWVMAIYDEDEGKRWIAFHTSPDLKQWTFASRIDGYFECPDIFELPVNGDKNNTRWVLFAADAKYAIGKFDGKSFTPEHPGKHQVHWGQYYASQTFNDAPDGRRIQIGWGRIETKGMPFNQMMTFPTELTLRTTDEGVRMFAQPIQEIEKLHQKAQRRENVAISAEKPVEVPVGTPLLDILAEFEPGSAKTIQIAIGGKRFTYDVAEKTLEKMPLKPVNGKVRIQILSDVPCFEVCGNDGRVMLTTDSRPYTEIKVVRISSEGGEAKLTKLQVYELRSIWK